MKKERGRHVGRCRCRRGEPRRLKNMEDDELPLRRRYGPPPLTMWAELCRRRLWVRRLSGINWAVETPEDAWDAFDSLADYETESCRLRSRVAGYPSPAETWAQLRGSARLRDLKRVARRPPEQLWGPMSPGRRDLFLASEALYALTRRHTCTNFRPSVAKAVLEWLAAGRQLRVLDPCLGWGDRLLGALAAGAASGCLRLYCGVDPNPAAVRGAGALAELVGAPPGAVELHQKPFEALELKPGSFDVVLTSPPFADRELYHAPGSAGQAEALPLGRGCPRERFLRWRQLWYDDFLTRVAGAVAPDGAACLYVFDCAAAPGIEAATAEVLGAHGLTLAARVLVGIGHPKPLLVFRR